MTPTFSPLRPSRATAFILVAAFILVPVIAGWGLHFVGWFCCLLFSCRLPSF